MGKRKKNTPQRADEEKQRCMTWNMLDNPIPSGSLSIISDNDPVLLQEREAEHFQLHQQKYDSGKDDGSYLSFDKSFYSDIDEIFGLYLEDCLFYLSIWDELKQKENEWHAEIGRFSVTILQHPAFLPLPQGGLPHSEECWLYVSEMEGKSMLYFEFDENNENSFAVDTKTKNQKSIMFWCVDVHLPGQCLEGLQMKTFKVVKGHFDMRTLQLELIIYARDSILFKPTFPSEAVRPKKINQAVQQLMEHFYGIKPSFCFDGRTKTKKHDIDSLFEAVKEKHKEREITEPVLVQHESLKPVLRPYQRQAVKWMLAQERQESVKNTEDKLHPLYEQVVTKDGKVLYYNKHGGSLVRDRPTVVTWPPGGILADEMGLGKTVEVLCCMLLHPRPKDQLTERLSPPDEEVFENLDISLKKDKNDDEQVITDDSWQTDDVNANSGIEMETNSSAGNILSDIPNTEFVTSINPAVTISTGETVAMDTVMDDNLNGKECDSIKSSVVELDSSGCEQLETEVHNNSEFGLERDHVRNMFQLTLPASDPRYTLCIDHSYTKAIAKEETSGKGTQQIHMSHIPQENEKLLKQKQYTEISISALEYGETDQNLKEMLRDQDEVVSDDAWDEKRNKQSEKLADDEKSFDAVLSDLISSRIMATSGQVQREYETNVQSEGNSENDLPQESSCLKQMKDTLRDISEKFPDVEFQGSELLMEMPGISMETIPSLINDTVAESNMAALDSCAEQNVVENTREEKSTDLTKIGDKTFEACPVADSYSNQSKLYVNDSQTSASDIPESPQINSDVSLDHQAQSQRNKETYVPRMPVCRSKFEVLVEESEFLKNKSDFFSDKPVAQKKYFECVCGENEMKREKAVRVQCSKCGVWQHAKCVNYDMKCSYRGQYKCPHCHVISIPVPSGATLIISPFSISHQWEEEIRKHIKKKSIKVFVYTGVNKLGFMQPATLADCDIVITTYETLRKEIDYVDLPHSNSEAGRRFRHPKRFMAIPSPIIAIEWWRICLDEAQMVECTTTKTAEMALRLSAVNRWCVTGTPIQKSVEDLYGLLLFLGMDPFWVQQWWKKLLYEPFCYGIIKPLYDTLAKALWRTAKKDVIDQIQLPKQTEHVHWLTFSPVEDHFYRRQYRDCVRESMKHLSHWTDSNTKLNSLDRTTMSQLLHPLLRLRQACCHPQAVKGEFLPINKSTMTMEELLESLTKKAKLESEESHRQLVAALNGLAGIHIIKQEYVEAVEKYREVLRSVDEHKDVLRTDDLQQLHAMHNLHEILCLKPEGVDPTLRDHQLTDQAGELRHKYMVKVGVKVSASQEALLGVQRNIQEIKRQFEDGTEWWNELLEWVSSRGLDQELVEKVHEDLSENTSPEMSGMMRRFRDIAGLEYVLYSQLTALESAHDKLVVALRKLGGKPSQDLVNQTVECCLRPVQADNGLKIFCPFCKVDELFNEYESKLFSFVDRGVTVDGDSEELHYQVNTRRQGTWADSEVEKAMKSILSFCKQHRVPLEYREVLEYGSFQIKHFEALKKEFKHFRSVWLALREHVSSIDELDMATTRLRPRLPDEPKPDTPQTNILESGEITQHRMKLLGDKATGQSELRKKLGQLLYLKNLAKAQHGKDGDGSNPDPCPICQKALGVEWSVLQCGHCFCLDCIRYMVERFSFGGRNRSLKCALCRQKTHHGEISYVSTKPSGNDGLDRVTGSHSTKVEAVIQCLLQIQRTDPGAKSLVFSSWQDVLDLLATALTQNNIAFRALHTPGKFQQSLTLFKEKDDITTLLLPVHSGSNGLNLIEATYVLLVEPILNPAQELQAIGRVHRIGQTRPTQVHKFLVRGTIEQRIHNMVKTISESPSIRNNDETAMTIGDLTNLFQDEAPSDDYSNAAGEGPSRLEQELASTSN